MQKSLNLLFVCLGNICRSPMAAALARKYCLEKNIQHVHIESRGTGDWNLGKPADHQMQAIAPHFNVSLGGHIARQITRRDIEQWDYYVVMDRSNHKDLQHIIGEEKPILSMGEFEEGKPDIPDPYGGTESDFIAVASMIESNIPIIIRYALEGFR